ncbi:MAG: glycosyltransferase family protein [Thermomicrobiales bacterium]
MIEDVTGDRSARLLFYCHDTYGLGHLRRTLTLATHLHGRWPSTSQLIVTGSPVAQSFPYPPGTDFIKLPAVVKTGAGRYMPRSIATSFAAVRDMRRDILFSAARHFQPDALFVDHAPAGLDGEAVATLRYLKERSPRTHLILGLRDILDEAPRVRATWRREGIHELLDDVYDRILVYGQRDVYDVVDEYGLSPRAAAKTRYVGYLRRAPSVRPRADVRAELGVHDNRLVVVTAGGGGDGIELFQSVLDAIRYEPAAAAYDWMLVAGPLMAASELAALREQVGPRAGIHILSFAEDMASYLGAADAVVSMGGYNSVCELLSLGCLALIVPRVHPRREQLIRAEALSQRNLIRMLHPDRLSPRRLLTELDLLVSSPRDGLAVDFDGLSRVAFELDALWRAQRPIAYPTPSAEWLAPLPGVSTVPAVA